MSAQPNNFKLGVFTLVGIGLLVIGVLAFGAWSSFEKKSLFETYVTGDVSGLTVGSAVEFRGVRVGKVTHIGFSWNEYKEKEPGCVVVIFEIKDDAFVTPMGSHWREDLQAAIDKGLRARVKAQGVTGTCIVSLEYTDPDEYPPLKVPWTPKYTYVPSAPGMFGELLVAMHRALRRLDHIDVTALTDLAQKDLGSAGNVLDRMGRIDLEGLSTNAEGLIQQLRGSTVKLDTFLDDTDGTIKRLELEKLVHDADTLVDQLNDTVARLKPGLSRVDFDALNQTLEQAHKTIQNLDDVLSQLKEYPSGFIFGQPPTRLKDVQPANKP